MCSAAVNISDFSPGFSTVSWVLSSEGRSSTRYWVRNGAVNPFSRLASLSTSSSVALASDSAVSAQGELRAKPCCPSGPMSENCGQQIGMPPRIALGGLNTALELRNSCSAAGVPARQDVTCAPCSYICVRF